MTVRNARSSPGWRARRCSPAGRARGGGGHEHARLPAIRADPYSVPELDRFLAAHETWVDPEALEVLQEVREQHARAQGLVALSAATDAELDVPGLGGELKPFQRAGVSYLLSQRRAFLADEQGLGKTIEALATLQADGAFPAVVVCPASLKLNWLREIERWLPGRRARVLVGTGVAGPGVAGRVAPGVAGPGVGGFGVLGSGVAGLGAAGPGVAESRMAVAGQRADITVVNYDIVAARLDELRELQPRALVLDESHYCKNAAAKRTQAVQRLSAAVPQDGLVLALTGTPVMNRPPELISQLRILGRLADFGSGAQFGRRFRGPDAHLRLHWHLRARCFVRRLKADVLPQLPPKTRAVVPVELDNESEYRLAERDVIAWLQSQPLDLRELDAKVAAALRAERLVRLNALKLLAARGKLHARSPGSTTSAPPASAWSCSPTTARSSAPCSSAFPGALHILGEDSHAPGTPRCAQFQAPDGRREPADRLLDRGRRPGPDADALLERRVPGARLDAGQARPGRGPLPPHRPAGRGQRHLPARRRHDRRDDRHAAGAQARGDRRRHRRTRAGRGGRASTRSCASCRRAIPAPARRRLAGCRIPDRGRGMTRPDTTRRAAGSDPSPTGKPSPDRQFHRGECAGLSRAI